MMSGGDEQLNHLNSSLKDLVPPFNIPVFEIYQYVQGNDGYGRIDIAEYDDYDYAVSAASFDGNDDYRLRFRVMNLMWSVCVMTI